MCGIAGVLDWLGRDHKPSLRRMVHGLRHRGPDAQNVVQAGSATLGHARLAVIDVSPAANQPLSDASGSIWLVFNGEIYNYQELRRELIGQGAQFRTSSDSEVLIEAYKAWGDDCVSRFNGMFAFALWDQRRQRMLLARDRFGKKPLFYYLDNGGIVFASDPMSLIAHPAVPRRINTVAVRQFVTLGYVLGSECILDGVAKLKPAHCLVLERGRPASLRRYWDLAPAFKDKTRWRSQGEQQEALQSLIADAVRLRLQADVPLGAFLSGGIDSALIVAMMKNAGANGRLKTFSAGFRHSSFDETPQARRVAAYLGTDHFDATIEDDSLGDLPHLMRCVGEPFADTSLLPTYRLSAFARRQVTVALSGDGGDELFAGYETYVADRIHAMLRPVPALLMRAGARAVEAFWPVSFDKVSFDYKLRQFLAGHELDFPRAHYSWRTIFGPTEIKQLYRQDAWQVVSEADPFLDFQDLHARVADCDPVDQAAYVDVNTWLVDDVLVKVDRASMAHGLEARAPLLDYRVAEFAAGLPPAAKLKGFATKHILKRLHRHFFPAELQAKRKRGFNAPVAHWIMGVQNQVARDLTSVSGIEDWFKPAEITRLWDEHVAGRRDNSFRLFTLACFGAWLEVWQQQPSPQPLESQFAH
jgi:asparagine synthase (glutamine-hydrolysing)